VTLSELPRGWRWTTLGDICLLSQYGLTARASEDNIEGYPYIRITDIDDNGNLKRDDLKFVSIDAGTFERYRLEPGDILIARSGSVGRSYLFNEDGDFVFASYLIRFRIDESVALPKFVTLYLRSRRFLGVVKK
jgi:type I restriction enzyme S subunit